MKDRASPVRRFCNFLKVLPHLIQHHHISAFGDMKKVAQHAKRERDLLAEQIRHRA